MRTRRYERRPSGIEAAGELPWGSHFCVLHGSVEELLQALVPFVRAGLESNELCSWEVRPPLTVGQATLALAAAVPDLAGCQARGQLEIVAPPETQAAPSWAEEALERRLDRALLAGFEGLRLVRQGRAADGARAAEAETLRRLSVIAATAYPRGELGAVALMQVVQDHRFALVRNSGRWEALEGSEARSARAALERSEQKLQSVFGSMSEGFAYHRIVLDAGGRPCDYVFLEVNAAFERLTGLVAQDILGRRVTQVLPGIETDPTDWIGRYGRVALTGEPLRLESHAQALDRWYAVSAFSPHKGYFAVTFADITARKQAEAERREAEERLLVTLRSIGDAVIATDTRGAVTLMNRVAERLTGWSEAEARGRPLGEVFRIVNEETGAEAEDPVAKVIEQGGIVELANHTLLIARDGRRIAIADSAAPVRGGQGLLGVVLVFRDVTAARQAQQERELTVDFLRLVNENATTPALIRSAATFFQKHSGCEAVGLRLRQGEDFPYYEAGGFRSEFLRLDSTLCGRDEAGTLRRDASGRAVLECLCGDVIRGGVERGRPRFTEGGSFWTNDAAQFATAVEGRPDVRMRNLCTAEGYESVALVPLRVGSDRLGLLQLNDRGKGAFTLERVALWERLAGYLAVALARSLAEDASQSANARLVEADRRKNDFLAVLSHELRNPLAPIKNSLYVMERAAPGGDQAQRARAVIDRQVGQLARLVDDLLDVTRISRNKIQLQRQRLELNDLTRRTIEDYRTLYDRAGVKLSLEPAPKPVFVDADWNRLGQVVGNLLQNAAKFTPPGGLVTVALSCEHDERHAAIRVTDTGVGMTPEVRARLFEPFMQADTTLDRSKGGLGLGLALVKGIVQLHGGEVEASSPGLGKGTEFVVRLPLAVVDVEQPADERAPAPARSRRVLIIEDNPDAADSLRDLLEYGRHQVEVAYNGPDGIAKARTFGPDVVLCDIGLPGMDGYEVARALRAEEAFRGVLLVALSGYALPEDLERAAQAGFERHLAKPPSLEKLEELLGRA